MISLLSPEEIQGPFWAEKKDIWRHRQTKRM